MVKKVIMTLFFLLPFSFSPLPFHSQEKLTLRLDLKDPKNLKLFNFRTMFDPFKANLPPYPLRTGLNQILASGSGQFTEEGLQELKKKLKGVHLIDVDLRQESHGFADKLPVSWYADHDWANLGKTLSEVSEDEKTRLDELLKEGQAKATVIKTEKGKEVEISIPLTMKRVSTEQGLTLAAGVSYYRIPVTDHRRPTEIQVDEFLQWVKSLAPNTWLHFHCEAGEGRTTTFLVMMDILKNAHQVGLFDIMKRQWLLGGSDLTKLPPKEDWKYPYALERNEFLKNFHDYVKSDAKESWSKWIAKHKAKTSQTL